MKKIMALMCASSLMLSIGCSDDPEPSNPGTTNNTNGTTNNTNGTTNNTNGTTNNTGGTTAPPSIYEQIGGEPAVRAVIGDFVGRVVADDKINGYFLNSSVDAGNLTECLVKQVGELTGGPQVYDCRDMKSSHLGLGISQQDYDDLAGHLVGALTDAGVPANLITAITTPLVAPAFVADIVEDPDNNLTVYQRVGRKPAVATVVDSFIGKVVANAEINGFFGGLDDAGVARLRTCLIRQVSSIDGPVVYGEGVEAELGGNPCRSMAASHAGMMDDMGNPVTIEDFNSLVGDLVSALTEAGVTESDIGAIGAALGATCPDIVADASTCP